jgi:hypothetical protein
MGELQGQMNNNGGASSLGRMWGKPKKAWQGFDNQGQFQNTTNQPQYQTQPVGQPEYLNPQQLPQKTLDPIEEAQIRKQQEMARQNYMGVSNMSPMGRMASQASAYINQQQQQPRMGAASDYKRMMMERARQRYLQGQEQPSTWSKYRGF